MDLERKGVQSCQGRMYCRLMAFSNGNLRALHDRSFGFFRRQIILNTRPRPSGRVDDPFLSDRLSQETEGILLWALEGLKRLRKNEMRFTLSFRALENVSSAMAEGNNIIDFLASEGYLRWGEHCEITSRRLYSIYCEWCQDNVVTPLSAASFSSWMKGSAGEYCLRYSHRIPGGNGREVRGFRGIGADPRL